VILAGEDEGDKLVIVKFKNSVESQPPALTPIHSKVVVEVKRIPCQIY
jgi:hypothetical protein